MNDRLGHAAGDELLRAVGARLRSFARQCDSVARLGGDEFALILARIQAAADGANVAERIIDSISTPFSIASEQLVVGCSIGVAIYPHDGQTGSQLMRFADDALYRAKRAGRERFEFVNDALTGASAGPREEGPRA